MMTGGSRIEDRDSGAPRGKGVYYRREDYVSLPGRLAIEVIDILTAILLVLVIAMLVSYPLDLPRTPEEEVAYERTVRRIVLPVFVTVFVVYFVFLKASRFRTLGYRLLRANIVDLSGRNPGIFVHALRFLFIVMGPLNILLDLLWLGGDADRQGLRDKFARTYVIRRSASPAGTGDILLVPYTFLGWHFIFREVARMDPPPGNAQRGAAAGSPDTGEDTYA